MNPSVRCARVPAIEIVSGPGGVQRGYPDEVEGSLRIIDFRVQAGEVRERDVNEEATRDMFRGLLIVVAVVLAMLALGATVAFADKGGGSPGANAASAQYDDEGDDEDNSGPGNQYDEEGALEDNSGPGNAHDDDDCVEEDNSGPGNARDRSDGDQEGNSGPGNARDRTAGGREDNSGPGNARDRAAGERGEQTAGDGQGSSEKSDDASGKAKNTGGPGKAEDAAGKGGENAGPGSNADEHENDADCGEDDDAGEDEIDEATTPEQPARKR